MARPVTVYKDGRSVSNVYRSELDNWLADGWTLEPVQEELPPVQAPFVVAEVPVVEPVSRQAELEAMGWRELKAIAGRLGIEKADDQSWEDVIPDILAKEDR